MPRLAPGVAASAFHALMRLAYALLRDSADDVAIALGYWAATYFELRPATGAAPVTDDPAEVLHAHDGDRAAARSQAARIAVAQHARRRRAGR